MKLTISERRFMEMSQDNSFIDVNNMSDDLKNSLDNAGVDQEKLKQIAGADGMIASREFKQLFTAVDSFDSNQSGASFEYYAKSATPDSPVLSTSGVLYEALSMEVEKNRVAANLSSNNNFNHVKDSTRKEVYEKLKEYEKDPRSRDNLRRLATDPYFARLSREGQDTALNRFERDPQSAAELKANLQEVKDRSTLEGNRNFKKLDDAVKKETLDSLGAYSMNPEARKELINFAIDARLAKLPSGFQSQALKAMNSLAKPSDTGNVENLQKMRDLHRTALSYSFTHMDDPVKDRVLNLATKNATPKLLADLASVTNDDRFIEMSRTDQVKVLNVFEGTTPAGRTALLEILKKKVGAYPALETKGLKGTGSLIDQLDRLAGSSIDPRVTAPGGGPVDKARVMEGLLQELANPAANINQASKGTCTCTSMSFALAGMKPAEYARIVTDLAIHGKTKLANGDTIQPPADAFADDKTNRSVGERLAQSALMNYAQNGKYSNVKDEEGLNVDGQLKVLSALTGKKYSEEGDPYRMILSARSYLDGGRGPIYARLDWDNGGHAVEIVKVDADRVYFRNPWGGYIPGMSDGVGTADSDGTSLSHSGPKRKIEDGANGIESMSINAFARNANGVLLENLPD